MHAKRAESVCLAVIVDTNSILPPCRRRRRRHRPYAATVHRNVQKVLCDHFAYMLGIIHVLAYVVKIKDITEIIVDPDNNIDGQQNTDRLAQSSLQT